MRMHLCVARQEISCIHEASFVVGVSGLEELCQAKKEQFVKHTSCISSDIDDTLRSCDDSCQFSYSLSLITDNEELVHSTIHGADVTNLYQELVYHLLHHLVQSIITKMEDGRSTTENQLGLDDQHQMIFYLRIFIVTSTSFFTSSSSILLHSSLLRRHFFFIPYSFMFIVPHCSLIYSSLKLSIYKAAEHALSVPHFHLWHANPCTYIL